MSTPERCNCLCSNDGWCCCQDNASSAITTFEQTAVVGSANSVKIEAAQLAFFDMFGDAVTVVSVSAPSGVSDQPMSTEETLRGATNRAVRAMHDSGAEFGIGLEGGLTCVLGTWYCIGWVSVADHLGGLWSAPTLGVMVPRPVVDLIITDGLELGDAEDRVFGRSNSKQNGGLIGIVTDDRVSRLETFRVPLLTALYSMRLNRGAS